MKLSKEPKSLLRLCHRCNKLIESEEEILKCSHCNKSFLPVNYFERKVLKVGPGAQQPAQQKPNPEKVAVQSTSQASPQGSGTPQDPNSFTKEKSSITELCEHLSDSQIATIKGLLAIW